MWQHGRKKSITVESREIESREKTCALVLDN